MKEYLDKLASEALSKPEDRDWAGWNADDAFDTGVYVGQVLLARELLSKYFGVTNE